MIEDVRKVEELYAVVRVLTAVSYSKPRQESLQVDTKDEVNDQ